MRLSDANTLPFDEDEAPYPEDDPCDKGYHTGGWVVPHHRKEKYYEHRPQNERPPFGSLSHYKRPYAEQKSDPDTNEVVRYAHLSKDTSSDSPCLQKA